MTATYALLVEIVNSNIIFVATSTVITTAAVITQRGLLVVWASVRGKCHANGRKGVVHIADFLECTGVYWSVLECV